MKIVVYDLGHGVAILCGRRFITCVHLPFPVTLRGWRYLMIRRGRK